MTRALLLTSAPHLSARLSRLLEGLGCPFRTDDSDRRQADIVFADWAAVRAGPKAAIQRLSKRGKRVVLLLSPEEFFGPALSKALSCGATDVLAADCEDSVLAARVAAAARGSEPEGDVLLSPAKDLRVERAGRRVSRRRGRGWAETGPLSPREFDLLCFFLEHPGEDLARTVLLERVWGGKAADVNPETVDRHVGALRRRLGPAGDIRTLRGFGYRFADGAASPKL